MLDLLSRISRLTSKAALYISVAGLVLMTAIISWQIFARYVLNAAPAWTEPAALFLMLWFILFAAAAGVREGFHIRLTLVEDALSPIGRVALRLFCHAVVGLFGAAMAGAGGSLVLATWSHVIPTLGLPRGAAYAPIVVAGALIVLYSVERALLELRGEEAERAWP
ncbi:TRAP transporter small permease [Amphiplicatus metriothermophilus]|uniref:TRAP transporter small permease protein n=1 Tax=Amphiplicatus metriothermophilus TaxID=1519374 RepID=A0A239PW95_9PROT|nr:TRAP transporter small permease [Amphiplicatus metriothermophilus]MBB5518977.1 TRAP-type C4-dicarboxylate transport system permease small subunit [Amphiplicatus metriothermophilus]SNT74579.1 TRAP-type C4-dicarboxylate transport system, small permease component [Amphiplicatus metriothermophilus]